MESLLSKGRAEGKHKRRNKTKGYMENDKTENPNAKAEESASPVQEMNSTPKIDWMADLEKRAEEGRKVMAARTSTGLVPYTQLVISTKDGGKGPAVFTTVPPTEGQTQEAFERWAETYGNLIKELKRSGQASIDAASTGITAKTLSEALRAIRRAIKLYHYKSPFIDPLFDMEKFTFAAVGSKVLVLPRGGRARSEITPAKTSDLGGAFFVQNIEELMALRLVFGLPCPDAKGEKADEEYPLQSIRIWLADPCLAELRPILQDIFSVFKVDSFCNEFEVVRVRRT